MTLLERPPARDEDGFKSELYRPEYADRAHNLALLGRTGEQIAEDFGVSAATIDRWMATKPKFRYAVERGRNEADGGVARSLYERARGYSHDAVKIFLPPGAKEPVYAPYVEHYPPDTAAASLWLRNRQPKLWRERSENVQVTMTLEQMILAAGGGAEELAAAIIEEHDRKRLERPTEEPK